jgi:hypothetical protein
MGASTIDRGARRRLLLRELDELLVKWDRISEAARPAKGQATTERIASERMDHLDGLLRHQRACLKDDGGRPDEHALLAIAGQAILWLESIEPSERSSWNAAR